MRIAKKVENHPNQKGARLWAKTLINAANTFFKPNEDSSENANQFRLTFEQAAIGIGHCSLDGRILRVNDEFCRFTGYSREQCLSMKVQDKTLPEDRETDSKLLDQMIRGEIGSCHLEKRFIRADGKAVWINVARSLVRDDTGAPGFIICVIEDIDEKKRAEKERDELLLSLQKSKEELELKVRERTQILARSNADLEKFAYVASHDLQTPLRHVTSYVQLLEQELGTGMNPKVAKWMKYIVAGTKQMHILIHDLLAYSLVGAGEISFEEIDLEQIVSQVLEKLGDEVKQVGAIVSVGSLPVVQGVSSQLEQLFQNLIQNSLKFRKPDVPPRIEISSKDCGEAWQVTIADNGIGIDPKFSTRIFGMFQRLHTHEEYSGSGIGLAICKKIGEFHGGKIWVNSELGQGTKFHFTLAMSPPLAINSIKGSSI
jgi:PAS domain S-box-containing protein